MAKKAPAKAKTKAKKASAKVANPVAKKAKAAAKTVAKKVKAAAKPVAKKAKATAKPAAKKVKAAAKPVAKKAKAAAKPVAKKAKSVAKPITKKAKAAAKPVAKKVKTAVKKAAPKKPAAKKTAPAKKAAPKKAAVKKAVPAKKAVAKKAAPAKKVAAKKAAPAKKTATIKAPAAKKAAPAKKPAAKPAAKKAAPKKAASKAPGNSFGAKQTLKVGKRSYTIYSIKAAEKNGLPGTARLPFSLKVLLENLLRFEDGRTVTADDIKAVKGWLKSRSSTREIAYRPARVLMQDFTGVPAVVDHSVMVDKFGTPTAFNENTEIEYGRNRERYEFLRWGSKAFNNFRVVPPGTGICHQVNLEYLAQTVWTKTEGKEEIAYPDTCVGTDSHTTMVNGLAVLGWGVGGIEAEAAMLGQPVSMLIPEVIGFKLTGKLAEGVTATDMVLTITQMLRKRGVVGKFVEYFGGGLDNLTLEDRATAHQAAHQSHG